MISLNYRDSRPIYEQIKDGLRKLIVSGAIGTDEKLPSVRSLATQLSINPNTIQRAYNELEGEGYIYSVPGKGSFATGDHGAGEARRRELWEKTRELLAELRYLGVSQEELTALLAEEPSGGVPAGSVYGLVGPNGAGKSTLIRCLTGIYRQDEGELAVDGSPVWENQGLKARIAAIADDWYYFPQASIRDMCRFYRGFYPRFSMERYEKLKGVFDIDEKRLLRRLSKGMQKQAAFWLALSAMPDYLVLDEPVDGLDPVMRRQVWSLVLGDVSQRGTTVLVSSHNLRELEDVCDHVGILDHGKVLLERSLAQLQDNMVKLQVVFQDGGGVPEDLPVLHASQVGRIHTLIMRMNAEEAANRMAAYAPMLVDAVPLTLEEIFIYELGGANYAVKDIVF